MQITRIYVVNVSNEVYAPSAKIVHYMPADGCYSHTIRYYRSTRG